MEPIPIVVVLESDLDLCAAIEKLVSDAGLQVVTCRSASEFFAALRADQPGCIVANTHMPGLSGIELHERLVAVGIQTPVIIISAHGDVPAAVRAMRSGAVDFIQKPFVPQVLLDRIREAIARDARIREDQRLKAAIRRRIECLTPREKQVLQLIVSGKANKEVAATLRVSAKTVEVHRAHVMKKLEAETVAELVRMAIISESDRTTT